jgi:hypothetical protein
MSQGKHLILSKLKSWEHEDRLISSEPMSYPWQANLMVWAKHQKTQVRNDPKRHSKLKRKRKKISNN